MEPHITSTATDHHLTPTIIGFSGNYHTDIIRRHIGETGMVTLIQSPPYTIMLYYNPAVSTFHDSQDAIGVRISGEQMQFALADGVSIIRKLWDNDSGELAHRLVTTLCSASTGQTTETVNHTASQFKQDGKLGASTVIYGEIDPAQQLRLYLVGNKADIGTICLYTDSHVEHIMSQSTGTIGEQFVPNDIHRTLPDRFTLMAATDGLIVPDKHIKPFMKKISKALSPEDMVEVIKTHTQPSADDQSLLVISRH